VISGGFLKLESPDFWMTPSPYQKIRPQDEQRPRNFRAASGVASGATAGVASAQHPVKHPGNCRATSEQLAGSISRNCQEVSAQLPVESPQQRAQHPVNHPRNSRATAAQQPLSYPGNSRAVSG
jgi:hypothetical protein